MTKNEERENVIKQLMRVNNQHIYVVLKKLNKNLVITVEIEHLLDGRITELTKFSCKIQANRGYNLYVH